MKKILLYTNPGEGLRVLERLRALGAMHGHRVMLRTAPTFHPVNDIEVPETVAVLVHEGKAPEFLRAVHEAYDPRDIPVFHTLPTLAEVIFPSAWAALTQDEEASSHDQLRSGSEPADQHGSDPGSAEGLADGERSAADPEGCVGSSEDLTPAAPEAADPDPTPAAPEAADPDPTPAAPEATDPTPAAPQATDPTPAAPRSSARRRSS